MSDLPILDELGAEYATLVTRELAPEPDPQPAARRPLTPKRRVRRVARRLPVTVGLLFAVATTALAARSLISPSDPPSDTAPTVLGADATAGWALSAHRHDGGLCLSFLARGELTDACTGSPRGHELLPLSAVTPEHRYVVGTTGAGVARVVVRAGGEERRGPTQRPVAPTAARRAGVRPGVRWFVISLPVATALAPATVQAVTAGGRAVGRPVLDCSLGSDAAACAVAARRRSGSGPSATP